MYELARELGAEPNDIVERAALDGFGQLTPNSTLTPDQAAVVRDSFLRASAPSRGSLFSGGGGGGGGTTAPVPPSPPAQAPPPGQQDYEPFRPFDAPEVSDRPDAPPAGPLSGAGLGQPLGFTPPGGGAPPEPQLPDRSRPERAAAPPPSQPPSWDEPTSWDPLPGTVTLGAPTSRQAPPPDPSPEPSRELTYEFFEPTEPPGRSGDRTVTRSVVVGVLGLIVIVVATMFAARRMGIIGPAAERHCVLTETPNPDGEGFIEELLCVDGNGKEVRREVRTPPGESSGFVFGATADGQPTRVVEVEEFCRGAENFLDFRQELVDRFGAATSMAELGRWYDANDGFGEGGVGVMGGTFGNAGPNPAVVDLEQYLAQVEQAARALNVQQAQILFGAAEESFGGQIVSVRNFANDNC